MSEAAETPDVVETTASAKKQRPQRRAKVELPAKPLIWLMSVASKHKADIRFTPQGQVMGYVAGLGSSGVIYNPDGHDKTDVRDWVQAAIKFYPDGARIIGLGGVDALRVYKAYSTIVAEDDTRAEVDITTGNIIIKGKNADGRTVTVKSAMFVADPCDDIPEDSVTLHAVDYDRFSDENNCPSNPEALRVVQNLALRSKLPDWQRVKVAKFNGYSYLVGSDRGIAVVAVAVDVVGENISFSPKLVDIMGMKAYGQSVNKDNNGNTASIRHYVLTNDNVVLVEHSLTYAEPKLTNAFGGNEGDEEVLPSSAVDYVCNEIKKIVPGFGAVGVHRLCFTSAGGCGKAVVYNDRHDIVAELDLDEYSADFDINVDPALLAVMSSVGAGVKVPEGSRGTLPLRHCGNGVMVGVAPLRLATQ